MKIVCNTCNAKYSIADEKVKGKVFKIRCKKCGESIVVRGDSQGEQAFETAPPPMPLGGLEEGEGDAETRVFDYSGYRSNAPSDNVWYIVVEGEQQGPFSAEQLSGFMDGNSLDAESFVWKEGFDDWLPIRDVPELAEKLGIAGTTEADDDAFAVDQGSYDDPNAVPSTGGAFDPGSPSAADPAEAQSAFDSPFESGGGLFNNAADPETSAADVFSSAPSSPTDNLGGVFSNENTSGADSGGLFGGGGGAGDEPSGGIDLFGEGGEDLGSSDIFGSGDQATGPRINVQQAMTGQRNENSVLFSLSNLQALASGTQNTPGQTPDPVVTNTGGSDGSGLIDIRSLASSLKAESDNTMTGEEDFLAMGGGGFAPVLGAPVLAPSRQGTSKGLIIGLAAGGAAVIAAIVLVAVFFLGGPSNPEKREQEIAALKAKLEQIQKQGAQADSQQMAALQKQIEEKQEQHAQAEKKDKVEVSKKDEDEKEVKDEKDDDETKRRARGASRGSSSSRSSSGRSSSSSGSSNKSASASASSSGSSSKEEPAPARKAATSELDDLLGSGGGSSKAAKPKASSGGASSAPSSRGASAALSRADVQKGMNGVAARVKACGGGEGGTVTLKVVISSTGSVISASPTGAHAGTSVGNCAARAVRAARFPKSSQNLTVRYPFKL